MDSEGDHYVSCDLSAASQLTVACGRASYYPIDIYSIF